MEAGYLNSYKTNNYHSSCKKPRIVKMKKGSGRPLRLLMQKQKQKKTTTKRKILSTAQERCEPSS
jgi:hypothetical protein